MVASLAQLLEGEKVKLRRALQHKLKRGELDEDEGVEPAAADAYFSAIASHDLGSVLPSPIFSLRLRTVTDGWPKGGLVAAAEEGAWVVSVVMGRKEDFEFAAGDAPVAANMALLPYAATAALVARRDASTGMPASGWPTDVSTGAGMGTGDAMEACFDPWRAPAPYVELSQGTSDRPVQKTDASACLYASLPTPVQTGLPRNVLLDGRFELTRDRNALKVSVFLYPIRLDPVLEWSVALTLTVTITLTPTLTPPGGYHGQRRGQRRSQRRRRRATAVEQAVGERHRSGVPGATHSSGGGGGALSGRIGTHGCSLCSPRTPTGPRVP